MHSHSAFTDRFCTQDGLLTVVESDQTCLTTALDGIWAVEASREPAACCLQLVSQDLEVLHFVVFHSLVCQGLHCGRCTVTCVTQQHLNSLLASSPVSSAYGPTDLALCEAHRQQRARSGYHSHQPPPCSATRWICTLTSLGCWEALDVKCLFGGRTGTGGARDTVHLPRSKQDQHSSC